MKAIKAANVSLGDGFFVIAGPCVIESRDMCLRIAHELKAVCSKLGVPYVFKASFDKANRTSVKSYRGPGLEEGLNVLAAVKKAEDVPILTDIHDPQQAAAVAEVADILQIPAFLCRQTDLVLAAAATGKAVNIKKGQFLAPWDVKSIVEKVESTGNRSIILTERGSSFGYNALVVDMRSIPVMKEFGYPVVIDGTHSVQQPGGLGNATGGDRRMVPTICKAAVAAGADGVFLEVHEDPQKAKSDAANTLPLNEVGALLATLKRVSEAAH